MASGFDLLKDIAKSVCKDNGVSERAPFIIAEIDKAVVLAESRAEYQRTGTRLNKEMRERYDRELVICDNTVQNLIYRK